MIISLLCGGAVLVLLRRGARRGPRPLAVGAVVAVVWGWGVAQHPYLLPQVLTIDAGAAPSDTLTALLIVLAIAVVLVLPSIGLLFTLTQRTSSRRASARSRTRAAPDESRKGAIARRRVVRHSGRVDPNAFTSS